MNDRVMKPPKKREKICIERADAKCYEIVSGTIPLPNQGPGAWKIEIMSPGGYRIGDRYVLRGIGGSSELIVESVHPVANRDSVRVVFATKANPEMT